MKVYSAIAAVMADLAKEGIAKHRKNTAQGYAFRGIDDVYNVLSSSLARHGLTIIPRAVDRHCEERTNAKGTSLFYVTVRVEFDLVCAEDGSKHTAVMYGEAMDSGDKATNKALSAAYKYMAMELFCIPTEGDNDTENQTHEVVGLPLELRQKISEANSVDELTALYKALSPEERQLATPAFKTRKADLKEAA